MPLFRQIVCAVDFSESSRRALGYAAALAGEPQVSLTVLSVTDPLLAQAAAIEGFDPQGEQASAELRDLVAESIPQAMLPQLALQMVGTVGRPDEEILKVANGQRADLIVMGTHGLTGARKWFLGSTTERVLRRTSVPVLAIPPAAMASATREPGTGFRPSRIVVALDLEEPSATLARFGEDLAAELAAALVLLHVVAPIIAPRGWRIAADSHDEGRRARAQDGLHAAANTLAGKLAVDTVSVVGQPAETIVRVAEERQAGLIVMGIRSKASLLEPRPGSTAYQVLVSARCPVLAVPPHALDRGGASVA